MLGSSLYAICPPTVRGDNTPLITLNTGVQPYRIRWVEDPSLFAQVKPKVMGGGTLPRSVLVVAKSGTAVFSTGYEGSSAE